MSGNGQTGRPYFRKLDFTAIGYRDNHMERLQGKVVWFNNAKGFGFLSNPSGPDVFVHYSSIQADGYKALKEGDEVEFAIVQGTKGPQADNVMVLSHAL